MNDFKIKTQEKKLSRRKFLKNLLVAGSGAVILSISSYSFLWEPQNVIFERHYLPIPNLPDWWIGKKIIQVSDIHSSIFIDRNYIAKTFERINKEKPDIIVFTGDYVTENADYMSPLKEEAKNLKSRLGNSGKIAVIGNHDRWTSEEIVKKGLKNAGFKMLINESFHLGDADSPLNILGVDDQWTGKVDLDRSSTGIDFKKEAAIILSHNPDVFPLAASKEISVMLAGHTHGGQVSLPFIGPPILPSSFKYQKGFYRINKSLMYVNRGLGLIAPPVRILCPPEITVFSLKRCE